MRFVEIVTYFDVHPQHLETFLADCAAGLAEPAILDVLDAIMS